MVTHGETCYKVVLFSPDNHVVYNGDTPDDRGIGGGVTARVRLLRALASLGHEVTAYVNCERPAIYDGVQYYHFSEVTSIDADVFIVITTGSDLDLEFVSKIPVRAQLKILWIQGVPKPKSLENMDVNFLYVASNFLRDWVITNWGVPATKVFVVYNGIEWEHFSHAEKRLSERDPYALIYTGHPSKGLKAALSVIENLRAINESFRLDVFGGPELWGQSRQPAALASGVSFRGTLGQKALARELFKYSFCLALQNVPEGFGIAVQECKQAGIIVIASAIGSFTELIRHGYDGFLIEGDANSPETHAKVVRLISDLIAQPEYMDFVRRNAQGVPLDWSLIAKTWVSHWDLILKHRNLSQVSEEESIIRYVCPRCLVPVMHFPDGYRCLQCATYYPIVKGIPSFTRESGSYSEIYEPDFRALIARTYQGFWREAVVRTLGDKSEFLVNYILDESRGFFHYLFELPPEGLALDLGAGFGTISCALGRRCRVVALDNHWLRLAFLTERSRQEGLTTVVPLHGDALNLPFQADQFDLVTMIGVLEWAGTWGTEEEPEHLQLRLLREAHRVLKPGGLLVIGIENRYGVRYLLGEPDDHTGIRNITYLPRDEADLLSASVRGTTYRVRTHSRADYERLLRLAGFQSISFYMPYPDYRIWTVLIPLDEPNLLEFYLERVEPESAPDTNLLRAVTQLGVAREFVSSYLIVGRK
ncbi:MAG: methyltransferase domain-containing protein [Candidatus Methanomethylicaceae archaeon]